jgi:hypothetical protein
MLYILAQRLLPLVHNREFPMKVNRISRKRLAILSAAFWAVLGKKLKSA